MSKSPEMEAFLNAFAKQAFGRERTGKCCVTCGNTQVGPEDFNDTQSWREFKISHMCQECQDKVYGPVVDIPEE